VDNLTHALAGMLIAEAAVALRPTEESAPLSPGASSRVATSFRHVAYVVSVAGNNFPDLDFLWSGITVRPFGYLLHHRGHSHTLLGALAFALLLGGAAAHWSAARGEVWSRADRRWIFALAFWGPLLHIAMDFSNNYGTHPFWPLYRGWIYGDAVFILEPAFWAAGIPPLAFAARSPITRLLLLAVLGLGLGAAFFVPFVPMPMAVGLVLAALLSAVAARRRGPRARALLGVGASLAVAAMFFAASRVASAAVRAALGDDHAIYDVIVTPMPANPLCLTAVTVERDDGNYIARRATVATWPALFPARRCPDTAEVPTAPLTPSTVADTTRVLWRGQYVAPLGRLVQLYRDNCQAAAILRFLRAPYWIDGDGETLVLGDLRYDRNPGLDFSDVRIELRPSFCPSAVPSWTPPRHDMLDLPSASPPAQGVK
jgi:inner membrane protein